MKSPPKSSRRGSGCSRKNLRAIARGKLRRRIRRLVQTLDLVEAAIIGVREAPGRTNRSNILDDLEGAIRTFRTDAEYATLAFLPSRRPRPISAPRHE
jgi:hypothetical protein